MTVNRLSGKTALITAAGQGIGRATALMYAAEGARVIATDINEESLKSLAHESPNIKTDILDVTSTDSISAVLSGVNGLDILFNCAGYVANGSILDCEPSDWQKSFSINVDSMYHMCRAVLPAMVAQKYGVIINMSSVASSIKGVPNRFAYSATKAAVIGMSKAIAADHVTDGVRCNAICPGTVQSPSLDERLSAIGDYDAAYAAFVARQPMGRIGDAREIAALATYLASDDAAYTTGTAVIIDGGWSN